MKAITYKLIDLFGAEIRSRSNIEKLRKDMREDECYQFDLSGITFVSRSVADELCDMEEKMPLNLSNMGDIVKNIHDVVKNSRKVGRVAKETPSNTLKCNTMEDVVNVFANL